LNVPGILRQKETTSQQWLDTALYNLGACLHILIGTSGWWMVEYMKRYFNVPIEKVVAVVSSITDVVELVKNGLPSDYIVRVARDGLRGDFGYAMRAYQIFRDKVLERVGSLQPVELVTMTAFGGGGTVKFGLLLARDILRLWDCYLVMIVKLAASSFSSPTQVRNSVRVLESMADLAKEYQGRFAAIVISDAARLNGMGADEIAGDSYATVHGFLAKSGITPANLGRLLTDKIADEPNNQFESLSAFVRFPGSIPADNLDSAMRTIEGRLNDLQPALELTLSNIDHRISAPASAYLLIVHPPSAFQDEEEVKDAKTAMGRITIGTLERLTGQRGHYCHVETMSAGATYESVLVIRPIILTKIGPLLLGR